MDIKKNHNSFVGRALYVSLAVALTCSLTGCALTLPQVPAIYDSAGNQPSSRTRPFYQYNGGMFHSQADSCLNHMHKVYWKAKAERQTQAILTIIGGAAGVVGGSIAAFLPDDDDTEKKVGAGIAIGGGIVALVPQVVGDPAKDAQVVKDMLASFHTAESLIIALVGGQFADAKEVKDAEDKVLKELNKCETAS